MTPDVSVIVLMYNSAETIATAVKSLYSQTHLNFETVFIDDCSTDNTLDILYTLLASPEASVLENVKIIRNHTNKGTSAGTLTGINASTGKYIMRLDSDDSLLSDTIERMYGAACKEDADVVWAGITYDYGKRSESKLPSPTGMMPNHLPIDTVHFSICNKLIRRDLILRENILPFEGINCWEDLGIVSRVLALKPRIAFIPGYSPYIYTRIPGHSSLSRAKSEYLLSQHIQCAELIEKWFTERGIAEEYAPFLNLLKFTAKSKYLSSMPLHPLKWLDTFPETNSRIISLKPLPLHIRIPLALLGLLRAGSTIYVKRRADNR